MGEMLVTSAGVTLKLRPRVEAALVALGSAAFIPNAGQANCR
jgi:hypothetical protein